MIVSRERAEMTSKFVRRLANISRLLVVLADVSGWSERYLSVPISRLLYLLRRVVSGRSDTYVGAAGASIESAVLATSLRR